MQDEKKIGPITLAVAEWVSRLRAIDIPGDVMDYAKQLILDGIGCSILGSQRQVGRTVYRYAEEISNGAGDATVWGRGRRMPLRLAALVNSASAHSTNVGDTHERSIMHTNYLMPQAAIAVAERENIPGENLLSAIIAGIELSTRTAMALHLNNEGGYFTPEGRGWHSTGALGAIGTAACTGKLLDLGVPEMVQAIVAAGTQPVGIYRPCGGNMGKHLFAGLASANGIESAYLARHDFVAGFRLFEDGLCYGTGIVSPVYSLAMVNQDLGSRWETLNVDLAVYPTKKTYMAVLDALLQIIETDAVTFDEIEKVQVLTWYPQAPKWMVEFVKPNSSTEAFNSLHYVVAVAAHDGAYSFQQLDIGKYKNPKILEFAEKRVEIAKESSLSRGGDKNWSGGVRVITKTRGEYYKEVDYHLGQTRNPLSKSQLQDKFYRMVAPIVGNKCEEIIRKVWSIEGIENCKELTDLFSPTPQAEEETIS